MRRVVNILKSNFISILAKQIKRPVAGQFAMFLQMQHKLTVIALSIIGLSIIGSWGMAQGLVQVPSSILEKTDYGITISYNGKVIQHRTVEGWNINQPNWQPPYERGDTAYVSEEVLQYLGFNLPRLMNIRSSTSERFRIVFDLEERIYIEDFSMEGTITAGRPLELNMPALSVPWGLTEQISDINIQLFSDVDKTRIRFNSQQTRAYKLFSLSDPRRLVIDFGETPEQLQQLAQSAPVQQPNQIGTQAPAQVQQPIAQQPAAQQPAVQQPVQQTNQIGTQAPAQQSQVQQPVQQYQAQGQIGVPAPVQAQAQPQAQAVPQVQAQVPNQAGNPISAPLVVPPPNQVVNQAPAQAPLTQSGQPLVQPPAPLSQAGQVASGIGQSLNAMLENASDIASAAEQSLKDKAPIDRVVQNGVRYRRFPFSTNAGESIIHVVEVTPGYGEFRVVGSLTTPRTISELANGALVGINAGYFDPSTHTSIGLLKIAGSELAEPTRNRASIAFGPGTVAIDRVLTQVSVSSQGYSVTLEGYNTPAKTTAYTTPNARVGLPGQGVITVKDGYVIENKIGPRTVPFDGYAIVYEADINDTSFRSLAQISAGQAINAQFETNPKTLMALPYAVEAGPLLVENGQRAYNPDFENFENAYILNGRTHQAAIGARADGTVLFVAAESMVAQELIPLFIHLGADTAMRLDSGSSTQLFVDGELINKRSQRRVVSGIIYLPN